MSAPRSSRRKSVAFAPVEADEAPRSTRSMRRQSVLTQPPAEPAAQPSKAARSRKAEAAPVEADGGFKFKRMKLKKAAPDTVPAAAAPPPAAAAPPPPQAVAAPRPALVPPPAAPAAAAPRAAPPKPTSARPAPAVSAAPSALRGASPELLQALLQVCTEAAAVEPASMPPTMALALSACSQELRRVGATSLEAASKDAALAEREAVLQARVDDLTKAKACWDAAAEAGPLATPAASSAASADTRLIAALPPLPNLEGQLRELATLSTLCSDQVDSASSQLASAVAEAEKGRVELAKAVHTATFKDYLDVDQPKLLLRSIVA